MHRIQRRTIVLLSLAQIFSGLATGAALSVGSLLAVELSGSEAWAGSVTVSVTLGAAVASALLMRLAIARGRRFALSTGLLVATAGALGTILAASLGWFWLLLVSALCIGAGTSVNLQARFAATDLSAPEHRGRDLSLIVWMSTVGSVAGPNLVGAGESIASSIGVPGLAGVFVISTVAMLLGLLVIWIGLRPDPLLLARDRAGVQAPPRPRFRDGLSAFSASPRALAALIGMLLAHFTMVAVMSMTPVHLVHHGATVTIVGLTISLHIAGMFALSPLMGLAADRFGGLPVASAGLGILVVATGLAAFSADSHALTTVGLVLLGVGWSAATVAGSSVIVNAVAPDVRVAAQGVSDTMMSLAGVLGGVLSGLILAAVGYLGLGVACAVLCIAAIPLLTLLPRRRTPVVAARD